MAAITIIEYGDFQCPYCRHAHVLVNRLLREWGNEVRFVFRNFPLREIHLHAFAAAVTAEAAGQQGKYWEMHDRIFENQHKINSNFLLSLPKEIDLDPEQFANDSTSEAIKNKIVADFESGIHSGVNRTPSFFINGAPLLSYDESYKSLLDAVLLECEA